MTYKATVTVKKEILERVNQLLNIEDLEQITNEELLLNPKVDDFISVASATFENGNIIDIDVCSGGTNYYDNCMLKDKDGYEIYCFDCNYSIDSEMEFCYGRDTYIINIEQQMPCLTEVKTRIKSAMDDLMQNNCICDYILVQNEKEVYLKNIHCIDAYMETYKMFLNGGNAECYMAALGTKAARPVFSVIDGVILLSGMEI